MLRERCGIESLVRDRSAVLAQWAQMIAGSASVEPLPLRLCLACVRLAGADGGAITLAYTRTERVTLCVTDETAARLEDLQDVLGQGPGPEAYRTAQRSRPTWMIWRRGGGRCLPRRLRSRWGRPPCIRSRSSPTAGVLGVLTLYQVAPRPLRYETAEVQFLADALGVALLRDPGSRAEASTGPWSSRSQVHQATGMVIAQLGIGPDDALALLRAHAYAHATTLQAIAGQVISRDLDFTRTDSGTADAGTDSNGNETP